MDNQKVLSYIILATFLLISTIFGILNLVVVTPELPLGIVSFEFLWTIENGKAALEGINMRQKFVLAFSLGLDYLYILTYSYLLYRVLLASGIERYWPVILIGILDCLENTCLFIFLVEPKNPLPFLASICASLKFTGILGIMGYYIASKTHRMRISKS